MVGAINVDMVVRAPRLPGAGETVVGPGMEVHGGGKGANAAVAASRAGARVELIGAVGVDDVGASALRALAGDAVGTDHVARLDGITTGVALIVVDAAGENQIAVGAGANAEVTSAQVRDGLGAVLGEAGCVLVSTEIPPEAAVAAVTMARAAGVATVLNPAPVLPELADLLESGPILTPNRSELVDLARIAGEPADEPAAVASRLAERTGAPVIVTLGGDGVLVAQPGEAVAGHPAASAPAVVDTTGAGDTFNGCLAARLAAGDELGEALRYALAAGALSVAVAGARGGMPAKESVESALASA